MNEIHVAQVPGYLTLTKDVEPGIQRVVMNTKQLYTNPEDHRQFEARLHEFLKIDTSSKIMDYSDGVLSYLTESVIPTKQNSRPPLLLLFGNPAPDSVRNKCFFAGEKGKKEHRFWPTLAEAGIISFRNMSGDIPTFRTRALFNLNYESPFRIGLSVFYTTPSPASDGKWSGVAGLRKLFRARAFREIALCEKKRVDKIIQEFISNDIRGAVIVFQKDAYLGVKDDNSQERVVAEESKWCVVESQCSFSQIRLFRMPPTRYMNAPWYVNFLQVLERNMDV
jgi:hypothetical protein